MELNQAVKEQLAPIFFNHGFKITQDFTKYISFESDVVIVIIAFDTRERNTYSSVVRKNSKDIHIEMDGCFVQKFFLYEWSQFIIPAKTQQDYVYNLSVLFKGGE